MCACMHLYMCTRACVCVIPLPDVDSDPFSLTFYYLSNVCFFFKKSFQSCIVKNSYKTSLVLGSPKCVPWLGLRVRKFWNSACYRLLENALSSKNHLTTRLRNEKCFSNGKHLIQTMKLNYVIYGSTTVIVNLVFLSNTPTPDLVKHHLQ